MTSGMDRRPATVALTVWDGRISPVFDVSRAALVLSVEGSEVTARRTEDIEKPTPAAKLARLLDLGVDTLVCGAISRPLECELTARGIRVLAFVAGNVDEVVKSFLDGTLPTPALAMPGCCGRQGRHRVGGGGGGGRQGVGAGRRRRRRGGG